MKNLTSPQRRVYRRTLKTGTYSPKPRERPAAETLVRLKLVRWEQASPRKRVLVPL